MTIVMEFTPQQYLERERDAEYKSEYFGGRVFDRVMGDYPHGMVISNLVAALHGGPCAVGCSDLRVRTAPGGLHTYADLVGICGEPAFADNHQDTLLNPTLIGEVYSTSTEVWDRGIKFAQYRKIASLREYVLVSQYVPLIEVFSRATDGSWELREFEGSEAVCEFATLGRSVKLGSLYGA